MTSEGTPPERNLWALAGQLTAVAWEFLGAILGGTMLGYLADRYFGSAPWGLIGCMLLGTSTGLYRLIVILRQFEKRADD